MTTLLTPDQITINGQCMPLIVRRNPRAKRMSLRLHPASGAILLSLPKHTSLHKGIAFVESRSNWITQQLHTLPRAIAFADGAIIPVLGTPYTIRHTPEQRIPVVQHAGSLSVGGDEAFLARRLTDWLKKTAREECARRARIKGAQLDAPPIKAVTVREMRSRWGSCTEDARLSFCWRLIFAPETVLDYVVAHEVAHLREMNHSERFWRVAASLCEDMERSKSWLKAHGSTLYRYGV